MNTQTFSFTIKLLRIPIVFLLFIFACDDNTDTPAISNPNIDLQKAILDDFPLKETNYSDIKITQPIIENNKEVTSGKIIITLPYTATSLNLSLKSANIITTDFTISPNVGAKTLFSETEFVTYEIASKIDPEKKIHYSIKVIVEEKPIDEKLSLIDFEILDTDHNNKPYTNIDLTTKAALQTADSLVFCLFPVPVNYAKLTPAIKYNGSKIEYRVNNNDFKEYPITTGAEIDFTYPNTVDFKISNADNSKFITYRIIVDTEYPIVFSDQTNPISHNITVPNLKIGDTYNGVGITTWTNMGNYPMSNMSPNEYTNTTGPVSNLNIFTTTLSSTGGTINPGEEGTLNIVITNTPLIGMYKSTAEFHLNFNQNTWKIVNSPIDNYILNVGYKKFQLNIEGTIIN